ncbi:MULTISPECIES: hypothetical protein [unclassified Pseudomonas]|uniref:hypothetical protein n=1 Tax=Pseudomonas TaxID=286 RepID=UPI002114E283|nr:MULTISPECIES: hypothetical protein [unclassified Pseudomonas]
MPKFACVCGYVINLSKGTSEAELSLVSEQKIDDIGNALSSRGLTEEEFYQFFETGAVTVYRCPQCARLHVDEGGGRFSAYIKEVRNI